MYRTQESSQLCEVVREYFQSFQELLGLTLHLPSLKLDLSGCATNRHGQAVEG
jgi:hypothetical protein